jgi:undecaprenyl phosphate N,N'-diacetylbacillosamine 1-phosphate transferase
VSEPARIVPGPWEELPPQGAYARFFKPLVDRGFALILLLLLWPVGLVVALAVVLDSRGGAFYRQERVGRMGQIFQLLKFRSMVSGAEGRGAGALVERNDPRITRAGKWLRASSLDELPQLWNILRGEMSFVGPRPTLEYQVRQYDPVQLGRLRVRPGITGLAQVRGRKTLDWPTRILCDLEYVERISPLLDLEIVFRTPFALLQGEGQARADYWKQRMEERTSGGEKR